MGKHVDLASIRKGRYYEVEGFQTETSPYAEKLYKMGFVKGTPVELAPVAMSDPMIIQIRGSRIALRKREAMEILVREL